ncbi:DUF72 domain-containing protein [Romeria aff. gracilis LEGE 07310]|uniref:DUF72 domain-containing protein n=1 Tax=Vasconcelosia minhoensis LEGE 07310 TaxID=915328 RepID=A0A8J7DM27_9CYAN|nr:DUF72 domain-containing protein [Romeria gracilis]MBE9078171.1 DUF72 domain-containing protein [Romeria aff. gracilis LEGE 07310]
MLSPPANRQSQLKFRMGCAVWAFKDWVGGFYPSGSRSGDFLRLYGERLSAVEGNTTFYSIPDVATVARWAAATPSQFRFCPKLPRTITHTGLLAPHQTAALDFLNRIQGLGQRLGPVMVQLPPAYSPASLDDLNRFLSAWPRQAAPIAVEVRHLDWFRPPHEERLNALLTQLGIGRVLLDTRPVYAWEAPQEDPQRHSQRHKPRVPLQPAVTAPFAIARYIGHPQLNRNIPYLTKWVEHIRQWLNQGAQVYFFVHCPQEVKSPAIAQRFQELLLQAQVPVPPLSWQLETIPEQLTLF